MENRHQLRSGAQEISAAVGAGILREQENRQRFLLEFSDALHSLDDSHSICTEAARRLGLHLATDRASYAEVQDGGHVFLAFDYYREGRQAMPRRHRLDDFGVAAAEALRAGRTVIVPDLEICNELTPEEQRNCRQFGLAAMLAAPLLKHGKLAAFFALHQSQPRAWSADEVALAMDAVQRTWAVVERVKAETALRESKEKYSAAFDGMDEGFAIMELVCDDKGDVIDLVFREVNTAFEKSTGLRDVLGKSVGELLPQSEQCWIDAATRVMQTGKPVRIEIYQANLKRWYSLQYSRVGGGSSRLLAAVFDDVTERRLTENMLRESEERQRFLLQLSDVLRELPDVRAIGNRAVQMLAEHLSTDRCYAMHMSQAQDRAWLSHEYRRADLSSVFGDAREVPLSEFPECLQRMETDSIVVNDIAQDPRFSEAEKAAILATDMVAFIAAPLRTGELKYLWAVVAGCTHPRHWTREELHLVEDVVERTWTALERAQVEDALHENEERLQRANRAKDEFIAMLSHELRNPLAPIATTLQLMKLRAPEVFGRERAIIEAQVQHLTGLVDDLLDVARIASGKVELKAEPLEFNEIVAAAVETTQPLMEEYRQSLYTQIEDGLIVEGDPRRLVQVVVNLLSNAAKYSPPDRDTYVTAAAENGQVVLRVRDEGQGIEPDLLPHVFESFTQGAQSIDRASGGLGLGLAIVRNLVKLHGGSVEAVSAGRAKGSEFVVRLPLLERRYAREDDANIETSMVPVPEPERRLVKARVLIVDDYVLAAESLALLLQEMGYRTRVVYDGAAALQAVTEFEPDVALVDIGLPVMDGYEVARSVRSTPGRERLPLIAITGYGQASDHACVMAAGFDEHLVKPLNAAKIGELIEKLVAAAG